MFCPTCGQKNDDVDFCLSCGQALPASAGRARFPFTWRHACFYLLALAIAAAMPLLGLIAGIVYACHREPDERNLGIVTIAASVVMAIVYTVALL